MASGFGARIVGDRPLSKTILTRLHCVLFRRELRTGISRFCAQTQKLFRHLVRLDLRGCLLLWSFFLRVNRRQMNFGKRSKQPLRGNRILVANADQLWALFRRSTGSLRHQIPRFIGSPNRLCAARVVRLAALSGHFGELVIIGLRVAR